ncbi:hypothetical protein [Micromonospora humida]|uniref:Uncharacterized protein n=1 Tax=Micromonospora humida TaxID=2809018 RepID=A0ABS2IX19_9ACTN|nr:hypothetical protein [Micromonospora humida]MBM7078491.1 hypothetical protein [Micromonospora humida]
MADDDLGRGGSSLGHLRYGAAALMVFGCVGIPVQVWKATTEWATGFRVLLCATLMLVWLVVTFAIANSIITRQINYAKTRWPDDPDARRDYLRKSRRPPGIDLGGGDDES